MASSPSSSSPSSSSSSYRHSLLPTARRFWADFTLGFADGLTVPFALTAGLSSLSGNGTDTVVYAGLAEVSAGCISMGIGGYLSARQQPSRDEGAAASESDDSDVEEEKGLPLSQNAPAGSGGYSTAVASRYLAPLCLPLDLKQRVMAHLSSQGVPAESLRQAAQQWDDRDEKTSSEYVYYESSSRNDADDENVWPIAAGFSVALGYLIGGLLPLAPYFFTSSVGDGLRWSFGVCVVALFLFGFLRDYALDSAVSSRRQLSWARPRIPWRRIRKSAFEGLQMVVLGGIAAIAAVLCVRLFEGVNA